MKRFLNFLFTFRLFNRGRLFAVKRRNELAYPPIDSDGTSDVEMQNDIKLPADYLDDEIDIIRSVYPYTMTGHNRIHALIRAVKYVISNEISGDIVECGVWRGGSMMAVAKTLLNHGREDRELYLFDTFEGMVEPSEQDVDYWGEPASIQIKKFKKHENGSEWCFSPLNDVISVFHTIGYKKEKVHFVKGRVEDTLPGKAPDNISILRLDTDWYESTKHELAHLFPRLVHGGVIIIDDYGHWQGARKATDEYLSENNIKLLLNRIDYSGRIGVKL